MPESDDIKPLVFISHSANDALAQRVLRELHRVLSRDFEVLLDCEELRANDDWRRELHTWMGLCNGAVILLSEDALCRSEWVLREATILTYRREDEKDFVLIPVLLPGITPSRLREKTSFAPLELGAIQAVTGDAPEAIAGRVLAGLEQLRAPSRRQTTLRKVEAVVTKILYAELEAGSLNPKQLFDAAAAEMDRRVSWKPMRSYSEQMARHLLSSSLEKSTKALVYLTPFFKDKDAVYRLLDNYLQPFWVNPDAVPELARMNKQPQGKRAVCVNGAEYPFTSESYVLRACGVIRKWVYATLTETNGFEEATPAAQKLVEAEILRQIAPKVGLGKTLNPTHESIEKELYKREAEEPFFILVPKGYDEGLVEWLRGRFKSFTFFFLNGEQVPDPKTLEGQHILLLRPELTSGQEEGICSLLRRARSDIEQTQ
jgi:hypothetical protein